jgi:hypothetical protein
MAKDMLKTKADRDLANDNRLLRTRAGRNNGKKPHNK